jgi:hypothetical protein
MLLPSSGHHEPPARPYFASWRVDQVSQLVGRAVAEPAADPSPVAELAQAATPPRHVSAQEPRGCSPVARDEGGGLLRAKAPPPPPRQPIVQVHERSSAASASRRTRVRSAAGNRASQRRRSVSGRARPPHTQRPHADTDTRLAPPDATSPGREARLGLACCSRRARPARSRARVHIPPVDGALRRQRRVTRAPARAETVARRLAAPR